MSAIAFGAQTLMGVVTGMMVGDSLGAVATTAAIPATSSSSTPKATASGKPVTKNMTPKQSLYLAAALVVASMIILVFGDRFLKDARIG